MLRIQFQNSSINAEIAILNASINLLITLIYLLKLWLTKIRDKLLNIRAETVYLSHKTSFVN